MYPKLLQREELKPYFPDKYPKGRQCDKEYFWNVCATVFPIEIQELVLNANKQRFASTNASDEQERILVSKEWVDLLNAHPFRSAKKGKFIHLLKQGSKPILKIKKK